ncbi:hypothetical protein [Halobellus limi]|uniref:Uncharacterized protein n=1 Tax=Halobellus limi TaxID=699433 RepID=A0A1H5T0T6_9EURY|nr:hypothetical protein [Halobellus limi]SEF56443.1 hypothetical protein SAMN04488133_0138 [Halobellus limi]
MPIFGLADASIVAMILGARAQRTSTRLFVLVVWAVSAAFSLGVTI